MSFKYWQQRGKILKCNLIIQSENEKLKSIDLKHVKFNSSLLSHIIMKKCSYIDYLIKEIVDSDGNAFIYAIKMVLGEIDVTFIMAKNLNKKKHFNIQIKIKPSKYTCNYIKENTIPEESFKIPEIVQELHTTRNNLETRDLILPLNQRVIAVINHTFNFRKVFQESNKNMDDFTMKSSSRIDAFEIEIIESELIKLTHVNIFSDHLHSNIPVENKISYCFIEK